MGYSGEILSDEGPAALFYDATTSDGKQPALVRIYLLSTPLLVDYAYQIFQGWIYCCVRGVLLDISEH